MPDRLIRLGMRRLLARRLRQEDRGGVEQQREQLGQFVGELRGSRIAIETDAANEPHSEVHPRIAGTQYGLRQDGDDSVTRTPPNH